MCKELKGICTKKTVMEMVDEFINAQDKFIILALFNGIMGEDMIELRELKVKDIDFEKNIINVAGKEVKMDAKFASIAKEAIEQKTYIFQNSDSIHASEDYEINTDSEYVVRVKPTGKNNQGLYSISYNGLRTRIRKMLESIDVKEITPQTLVTSGVIHQLLSIQPIWKQSEVSEQLSKLGYKLSARRIYVILNKIVESYLSI